MCFDGVNLYVVLRAICIEVATTVQCVISHWNVQLDAPVYKRI